VNASNKAALAAGGEKNHPARPEAAGDDAALVLDLTGHDSEVAIKLADEPTRLWNQRFWVRLDPRVFEGCGFWNLLSFPRLSKGGAPGSACPERLKRGLLIPGLDCLVLPRTFFSVRNFSLWN